MFFHCGSWPTVLKLKEFSATQILREINSGDFDALKINFLTILAVFEIAKIVIFKLL